MLAAPFFKEFWRIPQNDGLGWRALMQGSACSRFNVYGENLKEILCLIFVLRISGPCHGSPAWL
jgi:hypothetical protein